jgi:hypothetical protein
MTIQVGDVYLHSSQGTTFRLEVWRVTSNLVQYRCNGGDFSVPIVALEADIKSGTCTLDTRAMFLGNTIAGNAGFVPTPPLIANLIKVGEAYRDIMGTPGWEMRIRDIVDGIVEYAMITPTGHVYQLENTIEAFEDLVRKGRYVLVTPGKVEQIKMTVRVPGEPGRCTSCGVTNTYQEGAYLCFSCKSSGRK